VRFGFCINFFFLATLIRIWVELLYIQEFSVKKKIYPRDTAVWTLD